MKLNITESTYKISEDTIVDFETKIGYDLPREYRQFMITNNGGKLYPNTFDTKDGDSFLISQPLFSIQDDDANRSLMAINLLLSEQLPDDFLAITGDTLGNFVCIKLEEPGNIYLWIHDDDVQVRFLAESLNAFFSLLYAPSYSDELLGDLFFNQQLSKIEEMLKKGLDPDYIVKDGWDVPLLELAVMHNDRKIIKLLHKYGAGLGNALDCSMAAVNNGNMNHVETVKLIKELYNIN